MGKANQGVFGAWTKRVGNVVGRVIQGVNVYSIYQPNVSNPRTELQQRQRAQFTLLTQFFSSMTAFLRTSWKSLDGYKHGSAFSSAVGWNLKNGVVTGTYPNFSLVMNKVKVADGNISLPYNAGATADAGTLTFTWADNSGRGDALADDNVMVVVYNPTEKASVYTTRLAARSDRTGELVCPTQWSGNQVHVYLAMFREGTGECSDSTYIGDFTL